MHSENENKKESKKWLDDDDFYSGFGPAAIVAGEGGDTGEFEPNFAASTIAPVLDLGADPRLYPASPKYGTDLQPFGPFEPAFGYDSEDIGVIDLIKRPHGLSG